MDSGTVHLSKSRSAWKSDSSTTTTRNNNNNNNNNKSIISPVDLHFSEL